MLAGFLEMMDAMDDNEPVEAPLGQQLIDAAMEGNIERVGALLDQGVTVDFRDGCQYTPLMWASDGGHRAVAALLLDRGAHVNAENQWGGTPAIKASIGGHLDTLQLLVSRGADIHHVKNQDGHSSLLCAALLNNLSVCEYLLSLGADLMAANNFNETALANYGDHADPRLSSETQSLRVAALEAWWAIGPHPSQVQRRRDERWARRGPLITVLAENGYRPLQLRTQAITAAAPSFQPNVKPVATASSSATHSFWLWRFPTASCGCWPRAQHLVPGSPLQPVALATRQQRHALLLGMVFSCDPIVRQVATWL